MAKKPSKQQAENNVQVNATINMPEGFKVKRQITLPTLSMKTPSQAKILRFDEAMKVSTYVDPDPTKAKEKPATIAMVTDMENGQIFQFIVPSVVQANLERDYCETKKDKEGKVVEVLKANYVGLIFRIENLGKRPGKRYWDFSIFEVEAS